MDKNQENLIMEVSAPGKVILSGQHAVVYGENGLAMAISLKCKSKVYESINNNNQIKLTIESNQFKQIYQFNNKYYQLLSKQYSYPEFKNSFINIYNTDDENLIGFAYKVCVYMRGLLLIGNQNNLNCSKGYHIKLLSQVPISKCLGSSASFNCTLAAILLEIYGYSGWIENNQQQIQSKQVNYQKLNAVFRLSMKFQQVEHGRCSGIDNYTVIYGGLVQYIGKADNFCKFRQVKKPILQKFLQYFRILLVDSSLLKSTKQAIASVASKLNSAQSDKFKYMIHQIGTYSQKITSYLQTINQDQQINKKQILKIISQNHCRLASLGVSNESIQQIVKYFTIEGKMSAKITGAGKGGYVLVLCDREYQPIYSKFQDKTILAQIDCFGLEIKKH